MLKKFCDVCEKEMPSLDSGYEVSIYTDIENENENENDLEFYRRAKAFEAGKMANVYTCSWDCTLRLDDNTGRMRSAIQKVNKLNQKGQGPKNLNILTINIGAIDALFSVMLKSKMINYDEDSTTLSVNTNNQEVRLVRGIVPNELSIIEPAEESDSVIVHPFSDDDVHKATEAITNFNNAYAESRLSQEAMNLVIGNAMTVQGN